MVHFRTDLSAPDEGTRLSADSCNDNLDIDVLIVGAGFGGVYLLHRLRGELGLKCKIYEAGADLGGVWHWNSYPGARVDTEIPVYEYSFEKVWKEWHWTEKYPGFVELRKYFDHVENVLDVKKDVAFNTKVAGAQFDSKTKKWQIRTEDGRTTRSRFLINAIGFAAKRHFPDWKGLDTFKGQMYHSSFWPQEGVDLKGKKVAVIGTGSTGVQIAQETSREAASLTVFQRTPNLCLPMRQRKVSREEQEEAKKTYPELYRYRLTTFSGFPYDFAERETFSDTPEQREAFYQELWDKGGFHFFLGMYNDTLRDKAANDEAYEFWARKTRERISDPVKRDLLAPLVAPHAWGTKRPSLEQDYYEQLDKPQNTVVDVNTNPIVEFRESGIVTADGRLREFDVIALATGFDAVTGGMKDLGLRDEDGVLLSERWKTGTWSYLGMTCNGFPNMFFLYGAQAPTAFSNGPTCVEVQGDWIVSLIAKMRRDKITYLNATKEAEEGWRDLVTQISDLTLFPGTSSWYMGANVPGKPREQLNFLGGIPLYQMLIREVLEEDYKGFVTASACAL